MDNVTNQYPKHFEVSADWMESCGHGLYATVFPVTKVEAIRPNPSSTFTIYYVTVLMDCRYEWIVDSRRGKFVKL